MTTIDKYFMFRKYSCIAGCSKALAIDIINGRGHRGKCGEGLLHACISSISGDRALASRQSKMCRQKHGRFWPKIRHMTY